MKRPPRPRDEHSAARAGLVLDFCEDRKKPRSMAAIVSHLGTHPANRVRAAVHNLVNRRELVNLNEGTGPGGRRGLYVAAAAVATTKPRTGFDAGALIQAWQIGITGRPITGSDLDTRT